MPTIVVMNAGIDHTMGLAAPRDWLVRSTLRHLWLAKPGDVYISPAPIPDRVLKYTLETLGMAPDAVELLTLDTVVSDELLRSRAVLDALQAAVKEPGEWAVMPCFESKGVAAMKRLLAIPAPEASEFAAQRGADLLNRKSLFRRLIAGAGLPLPPGDVVQSAPELGHALNGLLGFTGKVIVKRDDGAGGLGNVLVSNEPSEILPGTVRAVWVQGDVMACADRLWSDLADSLSPELVAEAYFPSTDRCYLEYEIGTRGRPTLSHAGTVRDPGPGGREGVLPRMGLQIPTLLPDHAVAQAVTLATGVAELAGRIGYRGAANIDLVRTEEEAVLFNEINARWGGGTVLHAIARRLLGDGYGDHHALSSLRGLPALDLDHLVRVLYRQGLHYSEASNEGAIVLACDPERSSTMELLVVGQGRDRVDTLESALLDCLAALIAR